MELKITNGDHESPIASSSLSMSASIMPTAAAPGSESTSASSPPQLTEEEVREKLSSMEPLADTTEVVHSDNLYCPECYLPLHPDPKPERLYIFLHALKYTTSLGSFETEMPDWAAEGWTWDRG